MTNVKPKLLLHICCGPCATWSAKSLMDDYQVVLYFYNPNIWPYEEWQRRLAAAEQVAIAYNLPIIVDDSDQTAWLKKAQPLASEPERGRRCRLCYGWRLKKTAERASRDGFDYFATSLTVSPYKDKEAINQIGEIIANQEQVKYLATNFQKDSGYQKSIILSKELGLYRQKYCGCQFAAQ